jgi:hypothetical protein
VNFCEKKGSEDTYFRRFKRYIENLYDHSRIYRDLVYVSKLVKMLIYFITGLSIIVVVFLGKPMASLEDIVTWMGHTSFGRIIAIFIAFSLMIYGIEKLR